MLPHILTHSRTDRSAAARALHTEAIWSAIETFLGEHPRATTMQVSVAIGLSAPATLSRLEEMRELGEVRYEPNYRQGARRAQIRAWSLGLDEEVARADQLQPRLVRAVQVGGFLRDPLVAALFGAPAGAQQVAA
jgi:hypothetical protein